ncbi:unnamed protein product [Diabrotica balteata]|uniref:Uncharacterized protein n=1 Tax=Diabrotica balteata TaxID=107213 RepID=A0A9N9XHF2_DIABA|nr:unnamed protein product [Diabrotica balteata]
MNNGHTSRRLEHALQKLDHPHSIEWGPSSRVTSSFLIYTKVRMLRWYVVSALFYGVESWTVNKDMCRKLKAFDMWLYRRILKIPWTDRVTNEEVLRRMNKDREVLTTIKSRKLQFFGHIIRNESRYALLQATLQGKIFGKRGPGRRRTSWLKNLRIWFNITYVQLFRATADKIKIDMMKANIRNG